VNAGEARYQARQALDLIDRALTTMAALERALDGGSIERDAVHVAGLDLQHVARRVRNIREHIRTAA
jgi:hypothetical protein